MRSGDSAARPGGGKASRNWTELGGTHGNDRSSTNDLRALKRAIDFNLQLITAWVARGESGQWAEMAN